MSGCVLKIARRTWEVGVAGSPVIGRRRGAFSTLLRRPGLRASSDGVLATKSERKMLASTCLYSLYAWLCFADISSLFICSRHAGGSEHVTLQFKDIVVQLQKKDILKKVYGTARPGQTLAIMGPSGKTCILDC